MFEPVASAIYAKMHNVILHEFGLIQHPKYTFLGASPDGITDDGVMLEIKCPMKRKITGEIPTQYYYQIQGQLDVCGLDECDYLECTFAIVPTVEEWLPTKIRGVFHRDPNTDEITYKDPLLPNEQVPQNYTDSSAQGIPPTFWVLQEYNLKRVTKDKAFMKKIIKGLEKVWAQITHYRENPEIFQKEFCGPSITITTECAPTRKTNINQLLECNDYLFLD